ncbi:MAG: OmpA family protein [Deltaproteobacteria bacterium]|nr:OmpA family protein [Deltaproteobacteria bacterium]
MTTDHTPRTPAEEREDDPLRDIWLFTLVALGLLSFFLLTAPRGCGEALRGQNSDMVIALLPGGETLSVPKDSSNHNLVRFLANTVDTTIPKTFVFDRLNFRPGSVQVRADSTATITQLAAILKAYPAAEVSIEGHTDNVGNSDANARLSLNRAEGVKAQLIKNGVAAKRVATVGYGSVKPIAPNNTEIGRAKNRRMELIVVKK